MTKENNYRFGSLSRAVWKVGDFSKDENAFLFKMEENRVIKLPIKVGYVDKAIYLRNGDSGYGI